jgi:hypothetical protein
VKNRHVAAALVRRNWTPRYPECTPWWWLASHTYLVVLYMLIYVVLVRVGVGEWVAFGVVTGLAASASQAVRRMVLQRGWPAAIPGHSMARLSARAAQGLA